MTMELHKPRVAKTRFDSDGVRKAAIAMLTAIYRSGRHGTLAEILVALEAVDAQLECQPHNLISLSEKLGMPYSTVERLVSALATEARADGFLELEPDPIEGQKKRIGMSGEAVAEFGPLHTATVEQAMLEYYGQSIYKLKKKRSTDEEPAYEVA